RIGKRMVEERLAACANVIEKVHSLYWWKGKLEESGEAVLLLKTKKDKIKKIIAMVKKLHSYENPAIVAFPILEGSEEYLKWIEGEIR
ncbi:MAG: divalent-cation tolerance protein CutA, partial [Euryarchaeota archaeon]|nr:divalent-cation tolerance protein CutA [Euryarchaeota archaeon]